MSDQSADGCMKARHTPVWSATIEESCSVNIASVNSPNSSDSKKSVSGASAAAAGGSSTAAQGLLSALVPPALVRAIASGCMMALLKSGAAKRVCGIVIGKGLWQKPLPSNLPNTSLQHVIPFNAVWPNQLGQIV